jgi:hypothetical protein
MNIHNASSLKGKPHPANISMVKYMVGDVLSSRSLSDVNAFVPLVVADAIAAMIVLICVIVEEEAAVALAVAVVAFVAVENIAAAVILDVLLIIWSWLRLWLLL